MELDSLTLDRSTANKLNPTVLITGAAGRLGRAASRELLKQGWKVRAYDRVASPAGESIIGELNDREALLCAARGADALIHLAATPDDADFVSELLPNNLLGLYHALEAAREAGIRRVVLASSGQVNWWQQFQGPLPVSVEDPITPRGWYAVTKVSMEAAGQIYARNHEMAVIAARLGWCPRTKDQVLELEQSYHGRHVYFSPRDVGTFFAATVKSNIPVGFHVVFGASLPVDRIVFDLVPTQRLLGWVPVDRWPNGIEEDVLP